MYSSINFKTKKAFKEHVARYLEQQANGVAVEERPVRPVEVYAPGLGTPPTNGTCCVEGPHYPKPHTWYASVTIKDGIVVKVK